MTVALPSLDHLGRLGRRSVEVVFDVGPGAKLLGPTLDLGVQTALVQHGTDRLPHLGEGRQGLAEPGHLGRQDGVVIRPEIVEVDEDPRRETLFDIVENAQLAGEEMAQTILVETENVEALFELAAGKAGAQLLELAVDRRHRHPTDAVALDLVEPQKLNDQLVEQAAAKLVLVLLGPRLGETEADQAVDVGGENQIVIDHRHDAVDEDLPGGRLGREDTEDTEDDGRRQISEEVADQFPDRLPWTMRVKFSGLMKPPPQASSHAAVGLASTVASAECPALTCLAIAVRTPRNMAR